MILEDADLGYPEWAVGLAFALLHSCSRHILTYIRTIYIYIYKLTCGLLDLEF